MRAEQLGRAVLGVAAGALMLATLGVAADATGAAGYQPMTALINGSTVSDEVGILKNGSPISLESLNGGAGTDTGDGGPGKNFYKEIEQHP